MEHETGSANANALRSVKGLSFDIEHSFLLNSRFASSCKGASSLVSLSSALFAASAEASRIARRRVFFESSADSVSYQRSAGVSGALRR